MWDTCSCRSESVRDVRGPDLLRICVFFQKRITVNNCGYRIRQSEGHRRPYRLGQSRRCAASRDARIPSRYLAKRPCCFVPGRGRNEPKPRNTPLNTVTIPRYSGSAIAWFLEPGGEGPDQHPATPRAHHPNWPVVRGRPAAHPGGEPDDVHQNTHAAFMSRRSFSARSTSPVLSLSVDLSGTASLLGGRSTVSAVKSAYVLAICARPSRSSNSAWSSRPSANASRKTMMTSSRSASPARSCGSSFAGTPIRVVPSQRRGGSPGACG